MTCSTSAVEYSWNVWNMAEDTSLHDWTGIHSVDYLANHLERRTSASHQRQEFIFFLLIWLLVLIIKCSLHKLLRSFGSVCNLSVLVFQLLTSDGMSFSLKWTQAWRSNGRLLLQNHFSSICERHQSCWYSVSIHPAIFSWRDLTLLTKAKMSVSNWRTFW